MKSRLGPPIRSSALSWAALSLGVLGPWDASAQEASSPKIEFGSSRIGGPGLTAPERRRVRSYDEPEKILTEDNLPPPGDKRRVPGLHVLAERHYGGQQWAEACRFYGMLLEEGGPEAVEAKPGGTLRARRALLECAKSALQKAQPAEVDPLLAKAERLGPSTPRHEALRRNVLRAEFRTKMAAGDVGRAHAVYDRFQSLGPPDEGERIWFGEQLARLARDAFETKDDIRLRELMDKIEQVAPLNTEYRALLAQQSEDATLLRNVALVVGAAVGLAGLLTLLSWLLARARVGRTGPKNPFLDD